MRPAELDCLEHVLPIGRESGTSQMALALRLGWSTRKVQRGFLALRRDRHLPLVAVSRPGGCYLATPADLHELKRTRLGLVSRALSELDTARELRHVIALLEMAPTLTDLLEKVPA